MLTKTKVVLAAALMLGTASAALAGDQTDDRGGFVVPGSTVGVNPVYHPDIFGNASKGGKAYGYVASPKAKQTPSVTREQNQDHFNDR
jgi:hypothetical protein